MSSVPECLKEGRTPCETVLLLADKPETGAPELATDPGQRWGSSATLCGYSGVEGNCDKAKQTERITLKPFSLPSTHRTAVHTGFAATTSCRFVAFR